MLNTIMKSFALLPLCALMVLSACTGTARELPRPEATRIAGTDIVTLKVAEKSCSGWHDNNHFSNYANTTLPQFGCATAHNFTQVIDRPEDYIAAKSNVKPDGHRSTEVIRLYREIAPEGQIYGYGLNQ